MKAEWTNSDNLSVETTSRNNKAVLVIDMPKSCKECIFCGFGGINLEQYVCSLTGVHSESPHLIGCPLRPLPDRENPTRLKDGTYFKAYDTGWNDCLDAIMGETEEKYL